MPASTSYQMRVDASKLKVLIAATGTGLGAQERTKLGNRIRDAGAMIQARAVYNVSGYPVTYQGGVFRVMVRTGTLKGAIDLQWPFQSRFKARVFVNGAVTNPGMGGSGMGFRPRPVSSYANAIERGHPPIDLKKTMMGKRVPFFGARSQTPRGPYTTGGLEPTDAEHTGVGAFYTSPQLNAKLAAKGKRPMMFEKKGGKRAFQAGRQGGGAYFISFRTVGKTGWIIPEAKPRPFMAAAGAAMQEPIRRMLVRGVVDMLKGN